MRFFSTLFASILGTLIALGVVFLFFILFLIALTAGADRTPPVLSGSVLEIPLQGGLPEYVSRDPLRRLVADEPLFDLHDVRWALRRAAEDERIEAVWLRFGNLDASWAARQELAQALASFSESGKPIIATAGALGMDEADYFLAVHADSIFAPPEGLFEYNGFYLAGEFYKKLLDKLEIEPQVIRAGKYKSAVEPFERTDLSAESEQQLAELLASIEQTFLQTVAARRGLSPEALDDLADSQGVFSAAEAHAAGLLDGLRYEDEVLDAFRRLLGLEADERVPRVALKDYVRGVELQPVRAPRAEGEIAIVYAEGAILEGESGFDPNPLTGGQALGTRTFAEAMKEARDQERVKAVVVRINSPGGLAPAADAMRRAIEQTAREKPVVVSMGGVAASGGYWMALAADTLVADPLTLTGSIGVFSIFLDAGDFFEDKLGITFDHVSTGPLADMYSGMRPFTPAERRRLQALTDSTYAAFLRLVARSRGLSLSEVDAVAQGRVWTGEAARKAGLVDALGGLDTALRLAAEKAGLPPEAYRVRELPRPRTFLEELNAQLNARTRALWLRLHATPAERALLRQARLLRRLTEDQSTVQARLLFDFVPR